MQPKAIITGASGFIGKQLFQQFPEEYVALDGDLSTSSAQLLKFPQADRVVHLAGISSVPECESNPYRAYEVNVAGTMAIAQSLAARDYETHLVFASTGQVYDSTVAATGQPLTEESPVLPSNSYSHSKRLAELGLKGLTERFPRFRVTVLRFFNHSHRSQSDSFFLPYIYKSILNAKSASQDNVEILVGNVDISRDLGSVFDLVNAIHLVVKQPPRGQFSIFNVCSGRAKNLRTLCEKLGERLSVKVKLRTDPARVRVGEPKVILGSPHSFANRFSWSPRAQDEDSFIAEFLREIRY